jgi:hypothetical protein
MKPDANTAYVTICRPEDLWALTALARIAPLQTYALDGPDGPLARNERGFRVAETLWKMEQFTYGRSELLSEWASQKVFEKNGSKRPWEEKVYRDWEEETYRGLERMAAESNAGKGKNDIGISVVRDRQKLEEGKCSQVPFSYIKDNAISAAIHARRTSEIACSQPPRSLSRSQSLDDINAFPKPSVPVSCF